MTKIRISTDSDASQREGVARQARLRGPCAEDLEPALESCVRMWKQTEIQRRTGVNGFRAGCEQHQLGWYRRTFGPFVGMEGSFCITDLA